MARFVSRRRETTSTLAHIVTATAVCLAYLCTLRIDSLPVALSYLFVFFVLCDAPRRSACRLVVASFRFGHCQCDGLCCSLQSECSMAESTSESRRTSELASTHDASSDARGKVRLLKRTHHLCLFQV